jgi:hypothetical protein
MTCLGTGGTTDTTRSPSTPGALLVRVVSADTFAGADAAATTVHCGQLVRARIRPITATDVHEHDSCRSSSADTAGRWRPCVHAMSVSAQWRLLNELLPPAEAPGA